MDLQRLSKLAGVPLKEAAGMSFSNGRDELIDQLVDRALSHYRYVVTDPDFAGDDPEAQPTQNLDGAIQEVREFVENMIDDLVGEATSSEAFKRRALEIIGQGDQVRADIDQQAMDV